MEKIIWVVSLQKKSGEKYDDGLKEINEYLANGWKVKHLSACPCGENPITGQAYVVIEKQN